VNRALVPKDGISLTARNYTRAGITRSVAKKLSGHLTESVFERYDTMDEGDLEAAG